MLFGCGRRLRCTIVSSRASAVTIYRQFPWVWLDIPRRFEKKPPSGRAAGKIISLHRSLRQYYLVQVQRVRSQLPRERPFGVCNRLRQLDGDGSIPYSANLPPVIGLHRATDVLQPYNIPVKQTSTLVCWKSLGSRTGLEVRQAIRASRESA